MQALCCNPVPVAAGLAEAAYCGIESCRTTSGCCEWLGSCAARPLAVPGAAFEFPVADFVPVEVPPLPLCEVPLSENDFEAASNESMNCAEPGVELCADAALYAGPCATVEVSRLLALITPSI